MGTTLTLQNRRVQGYQDTGEQEDYLMGMWESNGVGGGNNKQPAQQLQVRKCMRLECILRASTPKKKPTQIKKQGKTCILLHLGIFEGLSYNLWAQKISSPTVMYYAYHPH